MSDNYQARRILHGFVIEDGEIKCMCATSDDAEGLVSLMVGDTSMFEVGVFKEVVNLLKENDKEKMAGSHYDCPSVKKLCKPLQRPAQCQRWYCIS